MGLDTGFKFYKEADSRDICYFRKYYELSDFFNSMDESLAKSADHMIEISYADLAILNDTLEMVGPVLIKNEKILPYIEGSEDVKKLDKLHQKEVGNVKTLIDSFLENYYLRSIDESKSAFRLQKMLKLYIFVQWYLKTQDANSHCYYWESF